MSDAIAVMNQAIIHEDLRVSFELGVPVPTPRKHEVVIKAVTNGLNAIDWRGAKEADAIALHGELKNPIFKAAGKDFAGYVVAVGELRQGL